MIPLPSPPVPPEHILPPWVFWFFYLLAIVGLWWLWTRHLRHLLKEFTAFMKKRFTRPSARGPSSDSPAEAEAPPILELIRSIRREHTREKTYRLGLFDLSSAMRGFLTRTTGTAMEKMTVSEMRNAFEGEQPVRFFEALETPQFGPQEPGRTELSDFCELAESLSADRIVPKIRGGGP